MENEKKLSRLSSFKIVLLYAIFSAIYIYTSDYFLALFSPNVAQLSKLQTEKGLVFILITTLLLYVLVKKNLDKTAEHYQHIIDVLHQSDMQLQSSQEAYMTFFNHSPLPTWLFDKETLRFLLVNDAACSIYGFTQEEYASMTIKDIRPVEDIPLMEEMLVEALKNNSAANAKIVRHRKKNGEIIQVKVKTNFVLFEGKQVRLASAVDVTTEMNIHQKLKETNSRLQLASEIAGLGHWTNDLITHEIHWSDELYKIFEIDPQTFELNFEAIKALFHKDDQSDLDVVNYDGFTDLNIKEVEHRIITDTGKEKWIFERQFMTKDHDGKPSKLEGIVLDITKRKLHEQELSESNERFRILAKATVEAIMDWDIKNDKTVWGDGFETLFGYDLTHYDNYLWSNNIHPEDREKVLDDLSKTLQDPSKQYFYSEFRFLKADGTIAFVQHKGVFMRDANGRATRGLGAMVDLTESLERMRKIESQDKALKDISWTQSHVVRAPLANLLGFINLLEDDITTGLSDKELIEQISNSAKKLDDIIREIVSKTN